MRFDAIVIGGGPGGAAAGLALARQGRAVAIVERSPYPRRKVCGEFIAATSMPVLDALGVGDAVRMKAGPEIKRLALFAHGPGVEAAMPRASGDAYGRALGRDGLDTLLLEAAGAAGARIFQPWRAVAIEPRGDGSAVTIETRDATETLNAPVVIAAHGSWEPGHLASHLDKQNQPRDFLGFKAHFTGAALAPDLMPLLVFPSGYGGMVWADQGRLSLSCCVRRDALAELRGGFPSAAEAVFAHILAACPAVAEALRSARRDGEWLAAGPIRPGIRPVYAGDIFRVGNLAGESHPIIAEGISMALQSGWLLAAELGASPVWDRHSREAAARRYATAWHRQFATRIHVAAALARLAVMPPTARLMRAVASAFPGAISLGARLSGKTKPLPSL